MVSKSCDMLLDGKLKISITIVPKLSLIMIGELEDFGENWLEVNVVQNSASRSFYDIRTLTGDVKHQESCRYFVESIHKALTKLRGLVPEQIGSEFKFIINISLRPDILNSRPHMNSVANALELVLKDFLPQSPSHRRQEILGLARFHHR